MGREAVIFAADLFKAWTGGARYQPTVTLFEQAAVPFSVT
jgi:hypothetical protein